MKVYTCDEQIKLNEGFRINKFSGKKAEPPHIHEFIEIVYIYSGEGIHSVDKCEYSVKKGDMLFINLGQVHSFHTDSEMYYVNICIDPDFLSEQLSDKEDIFDIFSFIMRNELGESVNSICPKVTFSKKDVLVVDNIIEQLLIEFKLKKNGYKNIIKGYASVLVSKYLRECLNRPADRADEYVRDITLDIIDYIDEHCFEKITLNDLAAKSFYNPAYFCRVFKKCYGENLKSYIQRKRISYAEDLLASTDMNVTEISETVGYNDKAQFYRNFKKHTGMTPIEYRTHVKEHK